MLLSQYKIPFDIRNKDNKPVKVKVSLNFCLLPRLNYIRVKLTKPNDTLEEIQRFNFGDYKTKELLMTEIFYVINKNDLKDKIVEKALALTIAYYKSIFEKARPNYNIDFLNDPFIFSKKKVLISNVDIEIIKEESTDVK